MAGRLKLGQILISKGLIVPEQLQAALGEQEQWGRRLGMTLVQMGFLEEDTLVKVLASQLRLPVVRIADKSVNEEVLELVSAELAEKYRCLPLFLREEDGARRLYLAIEDPSDLEALDELAFRTGEKLKPVLAAPSELDEALKRHYYRHETAEATDVELPDITPSEPPEPSPADTAPELPPLGASLEPALDDAGFGDSGPDFETDIPAGESASAPVTDVDLGDLDLDLTTDPDLGSDLGPDLSAPEPAAEPSGPGEDESALGSLEEELAFEDPPAAAGPTTPATPPTDPGVILRALSQLLVEKGVIGRDELAERLLRLAQESNGDA